MLGGRRRGEEVQGDSTESSISFTVLYVYMDIVVSEFEECIMSLFLGEVCVSLCCTWRSQEEKELVVASCEHVGRWKL